MSRVSAGAAAITWGTPPPGKAPSESYGGLRTSELIAIAEARPGVWGAYDTGDQRRAGVYAARMRDAGVEAVSRRSVVYFRGGTS